MQENNNSMNDSNEPIFIIKIIMKIFKILHPFIKFISWILLLPLILALRMFSDRDLCCGRYNNFNIFQLSFWLLIRAFQILILFNIHFIFLFVNLNVILGIYQVLIVFILLNIFMILVHKGAELSIRDEIIWEFVLIFFIELIWILIVLSYVLCLGNVILWEFIKHPLSRQNLSISSLIKYGIEEIFFAILGILQRILILAHFINPFSISFSQYRNL